MAIRRTLRLKTREQRVQDFLDQFAHGSAALLRYVGLKGKGKLATVINSS